MQIRGAVLERIGAPRPYTDSQPLWVGELELADPGRGEILVRTEVAGVCHSDLSVVNGIRVRPVPMLLGHEAAGVVERVGLDVDDLHEGQRVVMTFLPRCGKCPACATDGVRPCVPGSAANNAGELIGGGRRLARGSEPVHHHLGVSAFATHVVTSRASVVPVAEDVPSEIAALLGCAVLTGGGAILNVGRPRPGQRVAVVGLGGVGMAAVLTALAHDDVEVIGVDALPDKLEAARELAVTAAYTPDEAVEAGIRADVVVEAAGSARALETALALTAPGGQTVTVGLPAPDARISLSPLALVAEARSLVGSYLGSAVPSRDIPRFVELWRSGRLPVERLISSSLPLSDINAAMDRLADGHVVRQLIAFDGL